MILGEGEANKKAFDFNGEHGEAGRIFGGATNIMTSESHGWAGDYHNSPNRIQEWKSALKKRFAKR